MKEEAPKKGKKFSGWGLRSSGKLRTRTKEKKNREETTALTTDVEFFQALRNHLLKKCKVKGVTWEDIKAGIKEFYTKENPLGSPDLTKDFIQESNNGTTMLWGVENIFIRNNVTKLSSKNLKRILDGSKKAEGLINFLRKYDLPSSVNLANTVITQQEEAVRRAEKEMVNEWDKTFPGQFEVIRNERGSVEAWSGQIKSIVDTMKAIDPILLTEPQKTASFVKETQEAGGEMTPQAWVNTMLGLALDQHIVIQKYLSSPLGISYAKMKPENANKLLETANNRIKYLDETLGEGEQIKDFCEMLGNSLESIFDPPAKQDTLPNENFGELSENDARLRVRKDKGKGKEKEEKEEKKKVVTAPPPIPRRPPGTSIVPTIRETRPLKGGDDSQKTNASTVRPAGRSREEAAEAYRKASLSLRNVLNNGKPYTQEGAFCYVHGSKPSGDGNHSRNKRSETSIKKPLQAGDGSEKKLYESLSSRFLRRHKGEPPKSYQGGI